MDEMRKETEGENLADVLGRIWERRGPVFLFAGAGTLVGFVLFLLLVPRYEAAMTVFPGMENVEARPEGFAGQEGTRGYIPGQETAVPQEFLHFQQMIRGHSVAKILFGTPDVMAGVRRDRWFRLGGTTIQTAAELADYMEHQVTDAQIGAGPGRRISYRHPDPDFARIFLLRIQKATDELIRAKARTGVEEQISWIKKELSRTVNPEHRQALVQILMRGERQRMLIAMDRPFSAVLVEPPAAGARPVSPGLLILAVGFFAGGAIGFFLSPVLENLQNRRKKEETG